MNLDTFQSTGVLGQIWSTIEKMVRSDVCLVPDFRGHGQDSQVFQKIAEVCFQSVLPWKVWLSNFDKKPLSKYLTVADEALVYLILENNFVDWLKISKKLVLDTKKRKRDTKYTMLLVQGGAGRGGVKKGWSTAGKEQYNAYFDVVEKARKDSGVKEMELELVQVWQDSECDLNQEKDIIKEEDDKKPAFVPWSSFSSSG